MSKIARLAVLVAALASLFAVLSSTAGATTFTNSGATSFHGRGFDVRLDVTNGAGGSSGLTCDGVDMTGNVTSGVFTTIAGTITFAPCVLVGLHTKWVCPYTLTPASFAAGVMTGTAAVNCVTTLATGPGTALCNITGSTTVRYTNPTGSTAGRLTLLASHTLSVTNASDASCSATGVATGTAKVGDLSERTISMTDLANSPAVASP
jgi:hypothetical protein